MRNPLEILQALKDTSAQEVAEEDSIRRGKKDTWYLIPDYEEPQRGFHLHNCRLCSEELECGKDECYWTYEYVCHNCFR